MKKKIISLCMTLVVLISLIPCNTLISQAAAVSSKRLVRVEMYDVTNTLEELYQFSYEGGFLTDISMQVYGMYACTDNTAIEYSDGRLISKTTRTSGTGDIIAGAEYTYNSSGQLLRSLEWGGGGIETTYQYDSAGKRIRAIENYTTGSSVIEYHYDRGNLPSSATINVSYEGEASHDAHTIQYRYDAQGRLTEEQESYDGETSVTTYCYDYPFFVLNEKRYQTFTFTELILQDRYGYALQTFQCNDPEIYTDVDGYVEKIVTTKYADQVTYLFFYDSVVTETDTEIPDTPSGGNSAPNVDQNENTNARNGLVVYSDYNNLRISIGSTLTLSAGILADGNPTDKVSDITFHLDDNPVVKVTDTEIQDQYRCIKLKGLSEGVETITINDSSTGVSIKLPITVYKNNKHSYTLSTFLFRRLKRIDLVSIMKRISTT